MAPQARGEGVVMASSFGFDPADATAALQAALDSTAELVVVDNVGEWVVRPLFVRRDNLRLIFEPGVVVTAKPGAFPGTSDSLITANGRENLVLSGYGATLRMQKQEYTTGEWRHVLAFRSCTNVLIEGLTLRDSGGDGIYLGALAAPRNFNRTVHIRDVVCDNNRRQGISVISAENLLIENSALVNTEGTRPMAGIDFEPNYAAERLVNCVMRNMRIENNAGAAVQISVHNLTSESQEISIAMEGIYGASPTSANAFQFSGRPSGFIELRNSFFESFQSTAASIYHKPAYASSLRLANCAWRSFPRLPFYLSGTSVESSPLEYGGVEWIDNVLYDDQSRPFLQTAEHAASLGCTNLRGRIFVFNPNGARITAGAKSHDIALEVVERRHPVPTLVNVRTVEGGFRFTRESSDLSFPLAVCYSLGGTTRNRFDYGGLPGMTVIPPGESFAEVGIQPREQPCLPAGRTVNVTILPKPYYAPVESFSESSFEFGRCAESPVAAGSGRRPVQSAQVQ